MATESDLRDLLRGPDPEGRAAIDVDAVLRRARARRRPRAIAASAVGALALVGVLTPIVVVSQQAAKQETLMTAEDAGGAAGAQSDDVPNGDDSAFAPAPSAGTLSSCGGPVVDLPSETGLVLEVTPLTATVGSDSIPIEVTLRNDGSQPAVGVTASTPVITFSRDGVVLWHTNGAQDAIGMPVDLAPGESMTYLATFEPVVCAVGDDGDADGLRKYLPTAAAGSYRLSAAIDFIPDDGMAGTLLITGPTASVKLHE